MAKVYEEAFNTEQDTQKGKFLTFTLDKEVYAVEIRLITEIISLPPITALPDLPAYVKGIVNIRGTIIPVMDMRLRFGKEPAEYTRKTCIVIIQARDISIGLIVDEVSEVLSIDEDKTVPPPDMHGGSENRYIKAIGIEEDHVKLILDCEKLLYDKKILSLE